MSSQLYDALFFGDNQEFQSFLAEDLRGFSFDHASHVQSVVLDR